MAGGNLGHFQVQFTYSDDSYSDIMEPNKARQASYSYVDLRAGITNDDLTGDEAGGKPITIPGYDEVKYGFTVGGPILKDALINGEMFFFAPLDTFLNVDHFFA